MFRKIAIVLLAVIAIAQIVICWLIMDNGDIIVNKFLNFVEQKTGYPLQYSQSPSITFFPNRGLILGESSWEKDDKSLSLHFDNASVMIASHSLLLGRFRIKSFTMDNANINIKIGQPIEELEKNWPRQLEKITELDDIILKTHDFLTYLPDNISITNASLRLIDPSGKYIQFSPLNITAEDVHPGTPSKISLKTLVQGNTYLNGYSIHVDSSALITGKKVNFAINSAEITPKKKTEESLSFSGELDYNLSSGNLNVTSLNLKNSALSIASSGQIASLPILYENPAQSSMSFDVHIDSDLKKLVKLPFLNFTFFQQPFASICSIKSNITWQNNRLSINNLSGNIDDIVFSGKLSSTIIPLSLSGELNFDKIKLSTFPSQNNITLPNELFSSFSTLPRLSLQVKANELQIKDKTISNIKTKITGDKGSYVCNPLVFNMGQSKITSSLNAFIKSIAPFSARFTGMGSVEKADMAAISGFVSGSPLFSGSASINASFAFDVPHILESLHSEGVLTSSKIELSFNPIPFNIPSSLLKIKEFNNLYFPFVVRDSSITTDKTRLESSKIHIFAQGNCKLPDMVDLTGSIQADKVGSFPFTLNGSIKNPQTMRATFNK